MSIDLSVVIVNYNTKQFILNCLDSIYASAGDLQIECIVIDNASSDDSIATIADRFPQVRLIANTQNNYFSAAYNQGIEQAQGRYIIALNPDTLVRGQALAQLVQQMDADETIGAATTTAFYPDGTLQRDGSRCVTFNYLLLNYTFIGKLFAHRTQRYNEWLWYNEWDRTTSRPVDVLPGYFIIAPQAIWQKTGGFNPSMRMYFSDDYFSRATRQLGKQTVYLVSDGIVHFQGSSVQQVKAKALRIYLGDLLVYTGLIFGPTAKVILMILLIPTWIALRFKANVAESR